MQLQLLHVAGHVAAPPVPQSLGHEPEQDPVQVSLYRSRPKTTSPFEDTRLVSAHLASLMRVRSRPQLLVPELMR